MGDILKTVTKFLFYALAGLLFVWTSSLTVRLVGRLLPGDPVTPWFALALFDIGALTWLMVFLKNAQGLPQRAVTLVAFLADLAGVFFVAAGELFLGGQTLAAIPAQLGTLVVWAVIGYTAANLAAVYAYHLTDPDELQEIKMRSMQDKVRDEALKQVEANVTEQTRQLASEIADRMYTDVVARLRLTPVSRAEADRPAGEQVIDALPVTPKPSTNGHKAEAITFDAETDQVQAGVTEARPKGRGK
jgi:hypothetical protein